MSDSITLVVALGVPLVVLTVLRINAVMVFLSLCLGQVLVTYVGGDATSMMSLFSPHTSGAVSYSTLDLILLLGPAVATSVFMLFSIHGHIKTILNILPAAGAAFLGVLLAVPLLAPGVRYAIEGQALWQNLSRAQDFIVGISALISLVFLWSQRHRKGEGGKHRR
jgi:hypothetical protein